MRRREFIAGASGVFAAWPLAAWAQSQQVVPVIGWLNSGSAQDTFFASLPPSYRTGLKEAGFVEHQNVEIDFRWGEGQYARLSALAAELVGKRVAVIAAGGPPAALAAKTATSTIPIVFTVGDDPVRLGLAESLNRPGGNATGISILVDELEAKRLGLLHQAVLAADTIAVLLNPNNPSFKAQSDDLQASAAGSGLKLVILTATNAQEIDAAFATVDNKRAKALLVGGDSFLTIFRDRLVSLATQHSLPTMFGWREAVEAGGLMSYGISFPDVYRQAGVYAGRILKGEKPADLPIVRPTKFDLVINLKAAKTLGLTIPSGIMAIADEVIE